MIRRGVLFTLTFGACLTAALCVITFFRSYCHVWNSGQASVRVCIANGAVKVWHTDVREGSASKLIRERTWSGVHWEMRRDSSSGYFYYPRLGLRWIPRPGPAPRDVLSPGQKVPEGVVFVEPTFKVEHHVSISLWVPFLALGAIPGAAFVPFVLARAKRRHRRARGLCVNCTYDLTGNVSGICPECGTPISDPEKGRRVISVDVLSGGPWIASYDRYRIAAGVLGSANACILLFFGIINVSQCTGLAEIPRLALGTVLTLGAWMHYLIARRAFSRWSVWPLGKRDMWTPAITLATVYVLLLLVVEHGFFSMSRYESLWFSIPAVLVYMYPAFSLVATCYIAHRKTENGPGAPP